MIQTGLIQSAHADLVTDAAYDFYGLRLATCSLDQRIKIWQLDEQNGTWSAEDDWKAHDAAVSKVSWAHPEFGSIIASSSFDRTVKVWEQVLVSELNGAAASQAGPSSSRWVEKGILHEARGTVRAVEFAPHHFGLKLATVASDNFLRIYECYESPSGTPWQLAEEIDVNTVPTSSSPSFLSRAHTAAVATPTQTSSSAEGAPAPLIAQALLQQQSTSQTRPGIGNREADGGWCVSWCKDRYWGEVLATSCGVSGIVKIIQLSPSRRPATILVLDPSPAAQNSTPSAEPSATPGQTEAEHPTPFAITSVAWAPSCGRSYHLIATGGRDGRVRIWKVKPSIEEPETGDEDAVDSDEGNRWSATIVADFDQHKSSVGRVEWNITGTVLSSAGNDGRIRLWKATSGGSIWRPAGSIGVEQAEAEDKNQGEDKDVEMHS
ncbi:WD40 repeat-like protein [Armillaria solidipes]|uniref:WD40 repeat-like protein n=1 Tax=Armillaria solidipes TaxID=1076256 RepID=A0A2H3BCJ2_9AGAR|nr:WD40 repeat-like protein [Armillaria solidipes]